MVLESYTCENCILQREETLYHLFLRCNFAKRCWEAIGLNSPNISDPQRAVARLKRQLNIGWAMELIMIMAWSIWKTRNGWIFENKPPTVSGCKALFEQEMLLVCHRMKPEVAQSVRQWLWLL
jgi:hypothetical protein